MIPLKDENPTRSTPVITLLLIGVCVFVWVAIQDGGLREDGDRFTFETAAIPCEVVEGRPLTRDEVVETVQLNDSEACGDESALPVRRGEQPAFPGKSVYLAVVYSMFLHGSWLHLGGNMLFLWIFGNNVEDKRGKPTYLAFYLLAGLVATAAHVAVQPDSTVPVVGASGAIAGVMGAYLVLWPDVPIRSLIFLGFLVLFRDVPAKWLLGIWFVLQFFTNPAEGVAWVAHVGGFVFGIAAGLLWRGTMGPDREAPRFQPYY